MDLMSRVESLTDEDSINFEDKISLLFLVMGAIFLAIIVIALTLNIFHFQQMEFESPFL
ncbi:MAG: hypothetical protein ACTSQI_02780 [Candidatus Helarchaeota archaeon]